MIDAAVELRTLEYGQRLVHRSRNVLASRTGASTGRSLFATALAGGAQAMGCHTTGAAGLVVGHSADLFTVNPTHSALAGRAGDALLDSGSFGTRNRALDRDWRHGRCGGRDGRHVARDASEARYRAAGQGLAT